MLSLLNAGEKSIYDLSRLIQPIDKPVVTVFLTLNCEPVGYQKFCDPIIKGGEAARKQFGEDVGYVVQNVDWSLWPKHPEYYEDHHLSTSLKIRFFKNSADAENFLASGNPFDDDLGDFNLTIPVRAEQDGNRKANLSVQYDTATKRVSFVINEENVEIKMNSDRFTSVVDIPESTIVVGETTYRLLDDSKIDGVNIVTAHGQMIVVESPQLKSDSLNMRVFSLRFPARK